ncbi:MAG: DUF1566 domain-containing protein [Spirochaetia bacterium]|nr:DUF1566 domain-containing protein [Spirochaetia bacterium]
MKNQWIQRIVFILSLLFVKQAVIGTPFIANADNTVTDRATGLVWQKCSRGQKTDNLCSGMASLATWKTAITYCKNLTLAGKTWRLPNVNELKSIVDRSKTNSTTINLTYFPATAAGYYWSASAYIQDSKYAWTVFFFPDIVNFNNKTSNRKTNHYYVRCVASSS